MNSCAKQRMYLLYGILKELGWRPFRSTRIFWDNKEALLLTGSGRYSSQIKHLALRLFRLRDRIVDKKLVIDNISTKDKLSDILTNFLTKPILPSCSELSFTGANSVSLSNSRAAAKRECDFCWERPLD